MKKIMVLITAMVMGMALSAGNVDDIIKKIDYNQSPENVIYKGKMTIVKNGKNQEKEMKIFGKGKAKTYVEFLSPPRDKGTKYLRLDTNLWVYLPSAEKTVKISGHQLREGMAGSDFSYEDQTERTKLFENYTYTLDGEEKLGEKAVYLMTLTAKPNVEVTYYKRKLWVDKEQNVVLKSEMYAKSGKLLKVLTVSEVKKIGDRFYTTQMKMEDKLKGGSYTEMNLTDIEIDKPIADSMFTMEKLEKKN